MLDRVLLLLRASRSSELMPEALTALQGDAQVDVQTKPWLIFRPRLGAPDAGLILYPGARVDACAFAPTALAIAAHGYLVAILHVPLNLAFLGVDRANSIIAAFPGICAWAVGGHSLGGVAAAMFAHKHPDRVCGLVLWASYPARTCDLSNSECRVLSIYATQDRVVSAEKVAASRVLLPASTQWVAIEGGNHGQFGWYGHQPGDGRATISREEQQRRIVNATVEYLECLGGDC
jgi:hypothetical protein